MQLYFNLCFCNVLNTSKFRPKMSLSYVTKTQFCENFPNDFAAIFREGVGLMHEIDHAKFTIRALQSPINFRKKKSPVLHGIVL